MHQHRFFADIIGVEILNFKVVGYLQVLKDLMLYLLDNHIFAIDQHKNIARTKLASRCPALDRRVERMPISADNLFTVNCYMNQFGGFILESPNNKFQRCFSGSFQATTTLQSTVMW